VEARRQRAADRIEHLEKRDMAVETETRLAPPAGCWNPLRAQKETASIAP
jgi:hypothetical protein